MEFSFFLSSNIPTAKTLVVLISPSTALVVSPQPSIRIDPRVLVPEIQIVNQATV